MLLAVAEPLYFWCRSFGYDSNGRIFVFSWRLKRGSLCASVRHARCRLLVSQNKCVTPRDLNSRPGPLPGVLPNI